jgi:phosphoglycolate phosphatase
VLAHASLSVDEDKAIRSFAEDYGRNAANASRTFPGVSEVLAELHAAGWRLAVCTNKPEAAARTLLEALGIAPLLAAIGGGDSFATRKPDPGHLLGTIAAAGGSPARSLMVGDHANDVAAARGAEVASIFALWGYGQPAMAEGATARAEHVDEIPRLAHALLSGR